MNCVSVKLFFNKNRHSTLRSRPPDGELTRLVSSCLSPRLQASSAHIPQRLGLPWHCRQPRGHHEATKLSPTSNVPALSIRALTLRIVWGVPGRACSGYAVDALRHVFALSGASLQSAAAPALRRAPPPGQRLFSSLGSCYLLTPVPGLLAEPNFQKLLEVSCKAHPGPQHTLG